MAWLVIGLTLAIIFSAIMDNISEGKWSGWWNKNDSWTWKWRGYNGKLLPGEREWYYLWLIKTEYKEMFPYSSTGLVWLTDGWHFFKFLFNRSWQATLIQHFTGHYLLEYFLVGMVYDMLFEIVYNEIKKWR